MSGEQTLRAHLAAAVALEGEWPESVFGDVMDHIHAALAILDGADWQFDQQRLIPDPKRGEK